MKKSRQLIVFALIGVLTASAGAAATWWWLRPKAPAAAESPAKPPRDKKEYRYVSLEKVVVMLRGSAGEPLSHYMAVDLAFKTTPEREKHVKEHLPLLRSVAVRALSAYPLDKASRMTVEELSRDINTAYQDSYEAENAEKPFLEALIGKLIIE